MTGHGVAEIGSAIPWRSVKALIDNAPISSALAKALYPEYAAWGSREKTNAILADIFDILAVINANLTAIGSGKRPKPPKPYPRPGASNPNERKIGRGALPHDELVAFFERKRIEHERHDRSRKGDGDNYPQHGGESG